MNAMSFSAVRTRRVFAWVSIFWFTLTVSDAVSQDVKLITVSQVAARCGENVPLPCDVSSSSQLDIKLLSWLTGNQTVCEYERDQTDQEFRCESTSGTSSYRLTLILNNIMPVNAGQYLCKLHSSVKLLYSTVAVTVQECPGRSVSSINESHAECLFSGVYPRGVVHWSQGEVNLTDSASTQEDNAQHGLYDILSTINVRKGTLNQPYTCSLWIPSLSKYLSSRKLPVAQEVESSGSMVKLQWICIVVQIIMMNILM